MASLLDLFTPNASGAGLLELGNVNLNDRPTHVNSDGSRSTVRSLSFNQDGREILVPTVGPQGQMFSDNQAIEFFSRTGQMLGAFDTPQNADAYARQLHEDQAAQYAKPTLASLFGMDRTPR